MIDTALNWIFKLIGLCQGVQVKVHQGFFNGGDTEFYFIKIVNTSLGNITKSISAIYGVPTLPSGKQSFVNPCPDANKSFQGADKPLRLLPPVDFQRYKDVPRPMVRFKPISK